jgi:hypothetical protein
MHVFDPSGFGPVGIRFLEEKVLGQLIENTHGF